MIAVSVVAAREGRTRRYIGVLGWSCGCRRFKDEARVEEDESKGIAA